jgi:hypothetical protein
VIAVTKELKEEMTIVLSEKGIECLCFVERESIGRHLHMGGCDMVVSINEESARKRMDGLVKGMVVMNKAMLVRLVARNNTPPRLAILFPSTNQYITCMYMLTLPT